MSTSWFFTISLSVANMLILVLHSGVSKTLYFQRESLVPLPVLYCTQSSVADQSDSAAPCVVGEDTTSTSSWQVNAAMHLGRQQAISVMLALSLEKYCTHTHTHTQPRMNLNKHTHKRITRPLFYKPSVYPPAGINKLFSSSTSKQTYMLFSVVSPKSRFLYLHKKKKILEGRS